ncbi:peptidylprolyl isomerase [Nostoc sp. FACHB-110]|uniref:peptidylprolyl isomerase n=1 Tax=Nostoc sp. FACHB-110 TaxID=2692834 RepID=UPI0016890CA6|nr:peptidylprolyl isomerase [Nostoc sp. FACHB-110]MBD2436533.1 peptidylprolyl isomerase [Nostoc sp. FACHB-110]
MESLPLLIVNEQAITKQEAVKYLQAAGKLSQFIGEILRQYIIEQEIKTRNDLDINPGLTEQAIIDFRLQNQLTQPQIFQQWLQANGTDYLSFQASISLGFKIEKLKNIVTEPRIYEYFIERKIYLDRVILSRIIVDTQELGEELKTQIEEGASFEQLAKEYSQSEERWMNGMMGAISRGSMPDKVRAVIDITSPGQIVGPIELEARYGLFRVEKFLPASLEDTQLKLALQNELFEQWLAEKIQKLTVKL